ncbi:lpg1106 family Dot/Icm T4SS effector [Legionella pneumophila]|uniref:lpg1106 family Dot/Icm T4SS effector n=1 Tax=Legionella pneumophila TaxID=446 RepID=UPI0013751377|nr:lpg1106 family Dot/Icm T4SS effector [Legionella pneumophila]HAT8749479.1 lpg1106 family Dot/Icm T4SS effector [Legionella pneumophila]HBP6858292.1 lpg1106 family Dot/Icm T4SS effector [Legionella pneumophila]HBP6905175.1 lpg1106 family Dot/Icm T4SS effector [Legionella pneumophila]
MRNNKMGEKIPSFFHPDNKAASHQILVDDPLIIKDSELLDLLNASIEKDEKYHLLISCIRSHSPKYLNQRIMVKSHITIEGDERTPPHWTPLATKREYGYPTDGDQNNELTTTLANIIATNELNFSSAQMVALFRELMIKGVDFTAMDQSPYLNLIHPKSGNNPLKSLIAASLGDPEIIHLLHDFMSYIENIVPRDKQLLIINNQDNFEFEAMQPAEFLLRLGHEDLVLRLYRMGAQPTVQAFRLACSSYGTTIYYEEAMECIQFMMNSVELSETDLVEGKNSLQKASPGQYNEMLTRILRSLQEDSKLDTGHSSLYEMIQKDYIENYQDKRFISFRDFCQKEAKIDHPLIQKYALLRIKQENVGNGYFSDYYRTESRHLSENKWAFLNKNQRASQLLINLINAIDLGLIDMELGSLSITSAKL